MRAANQRPAVSGAPLDPRTRLRMRFALAVLGLALATVSGCSNSILRNAAEAGYETLTDAPEQAPTPAR